MVCKKCYRLVDRLDKALDEIACLKSRLKRTEETQKKLTSIPHLQVSGRAPRQSCPQGQWVALGQQNGHDHVSKP